MKLGAVAGASALALVLGACGGGSPPPAQKGLAESLAIRSRQLPRLCTEQGGVETAPLDLGFDGVPICRGLGQPDDLEGLKLDVDRYPTVLLVDAVRVYRRRPRIMEYEIFDHPGQPGVIYFYDSEARVRQLSGSVLFERARFMMPAFMPLFGRLPAPTMRPWMTVERHQGGWASRLRSVGGSATTGMLFLPTAEVADEGVLGCPGGHVVWLEDEWTRAFAADVRLIRERRGGDVAAVLRAQGGRYAGLYAAEHVGWRQVRTWLGPGASRNSAFMRGLALGVLRVRWLVALGYPMAAWDGADFQSVEVALGRWTLGVLAQLPASSRVDEDLIRIVEAVQERFPDIEGIDDAKGPLSSLRRRRWLTQKSFSESPFATSGWEPPSFEAFVRWANGATTREGARRPAYSQPRCNFAAPMHPGMVQQLTKAWRSVTR